MCECLYGNLNVLDRMRVKCSVLGGTTRSFQKDDIFRYTKLSPPSHRVRMKYGAHVTATLCLPLRINFAHPKGE